MLEDDDDDDFKIVTTNNVGPNRSKKFSIETTEQEEDIFTSRADTFFKSFYRHDHDEALKFGTKYTILRGDADATSNITSTVNSSSLSIVSPFEDVPQDLHSRSEFAPSSASQPPLDTRHSVLTHDIEPIVLSSSSENEDADPISIITTLSHTSKRPSTRRSVRVAKRTMVATEPLGDSPKRRGVTSKLGRRTVPLAHPIESDEDITIISSTLGKPDRGQNQSQIGHAPQLEHSTMTKEPFIQMSIYPTLDSIKMGVQTALIALVSLCV